MRLTSGKPFAEASDVIGTALMDPHPDPPHKGEGALIGICSLPRVGRVGRGFHLSWARMRLTSGTAFAEVVEGIGTALTGPLLDPPHKGEGVLRESYRAPAVALTLRPRAGRLAPLPLTAGLTVRGRLVTGAGRRAISSSSAMPASMPRVNTSRSGTES